METYQVTLCTAGAGRGVSLWELGTRNHTGICTPSIKFEA